jgi:glycosyltransferase involved in cell wall biosynthesis
MPAVNEGMYSARATMQPSISVVIPTFNRARQLARALDGLGRQTVAAGTFDVIVVDDGSVDSTPDVLARPTNFPLIALRQPNRGPAAARNAGIAAARGEIILFIDDDVIPAANLIELHLHAHAELGSVVIGRMVPPAGRQPFWAEWEMRMLERQYAQMVAGIFEPTPRQFYTANASVRRDDLERAGLFDAEYRRAEDVELAYRLEELGLRFVFESGAQVLHDTPRTFAGWIMMAQQYGYYDMLLSRQGGKRVIMDVLADEFVHRRRRGLRALARMTIGYPTRMALVRAIAPFAMRAADALRLRPIALAGCSALFNLLYWDSFCAEFGDRSAFWDTLSARSEALQPACGALE